MINTRDFIVWIETVVRKTDFGWIEHVFGNLLFHGAAMLVKPSYRVPNTGRIDFDGSEKFSLLCQYDSILLLKQNQFFQSHF